MWTVILILWLLIGFISTTRMVYLEHEEAGLIEVTPKGILLYSIGVLFGVVTLLYYTDSYSDNFMDTVLTKIKLRKE